MLPLASCVVSSPCFAEAPDEHACRGPILLLDASIDPVWQPALSALKDRLIALPDVDRCATVRIFAAAPGVLVEVELADGRAAVRRVEDQTMLLFVIQSLITRLPAAEPRALPARPARSEATVERAPRAPEAERPRRVLEFAVAASARFAERPSYIGYGVALDADLALGNWLVGSWIRWNFRDLPVHGQHLPPDLVMASFLWGGFAGRRFGLGRCALDVTAGLSIMIEDQEAFEGTPNDTGGEFADVTLGTALRLVAPAGGGPGFFALLGGEVYPTRVGHRAHRAAQLPQLPAGGMTLALGFAWSVLQ